MAKHANVGRECALLHPPAVAGLVIMGTIWVYREFRNYWFLAMAFRGVRKVVVDLIQFPGPFAGKTPKFGGIPEPIGRKFL